jgi:hypothetical protein
LEYIRGSKRTEISKNISIHIASFGDLGNVFTAKVIIATAMTGQKNRGILAIIAHPPKM